MKKIFLSIVFTFLAISAFSQIKYYSDGKLTIGDTAPLYTYSLTYNGTGIYIHNPVRSFFLQFDIRWSNPRIAGTGDQIVFYNSQTTTFNDIQVGKVLNYSDSRAKTNIMSIGKSLDKICLLNPVSYNFKTSKTRVNSLGSSKDYGLLAQELEIIYPNLVYTDEDGKKLINYDGLIPLLIQSIKELRQEVNQLKNVH